MYIKCLAAAAAILCTAPAFAKPGYVLAQTIALGAPDRWDYVVFNDATQRVFVAHGDRLTVVDARSGAIVGQVDGIPGGTHGAAISSATGQGFTDDGKAGQVIAFDLKTLQITHRIAADVDADGIAMDAATGHIFVVEGDPGAIAVIDPKTDSLIATVKAGEKLEFAVADDRGAVFVAGEEKRDVVKIDLRTNQVTAHWATPDCESPHGIAIDKVANRLFMGCTNSVMMVVDARTGRVVAKLAIGKGSDAVAFDPVHKRVFSSNGRDGTITVYRQASADQYRALDPIPTLASGRTMSLDPATGRLFVLAADVDPGSPPGGRSRILPGTLKLLVFKPS